MTIIDVDTHFEPGSAWLDEYPSLRARLPQYTVADATVRAVLGDILRDQPESERLPTRELLPPGLAAILGQEKRDGYGFEGSSMHTQADPAERLAWMDRVGIDLTNVLCLEGAGYARYLEDRSLARDVIGACNDWLADKVSGNEARLMPAMAIDLTDMDWALAELSRMRARGSRTVLISPIPAPGIPPMDPYYEPFWSAVEDHGMILNIHIGNGQNRFDPAWANTTDGTVLRQLGVSQGHQAVQLMLNAMVFGGVFHRHPKLTLLLSEFGVHWFEGTVDHMEARGPALAESAIYLGPYPYELTPAEFVRRQVRITPLPRLHQSPMRLLERYPECVIFSSDYAHNESNPEPTAHYDALFDGRTEALKEQFMGGNIAECFARTGDPLPV